MDARYISEFYEIWLPHDSDTVEFDWQSSLRYISEFYEIWLPHDSDTVEFDWQSSLAGLYISIGGTRPTTKNADFVLTPSGRASLISLEKNQILQVAKKKGYRTRC